MREEGPGPRVQGPARGLTPRTPRRQARKPCISPPWPSGHTHSGSTKSLWWHLCALLVWAGPWPLSSEAWLGTRQLPTFPEGGAPRAGAGQRVGRHAAGAVPRGSGHPSSRGDRFSVLNPPLESSAYLSPACLGPLGAPSSARPAFPELKGPEAWPCRRVSGLESAQRPRPHQPPL